MIDKSYYTTVLSQAFSPCSHYLLAGNIYGEIAVFDLQKILNPGENLTDAKQKPFYKFTIDPNSQICSMLFNEKFLMLGTRGKILSYEWKSILSGKVAKINWSIEIPQSPLKDGIELAEVNVLKTAENGNLYAGCGDNNIHVFSLEDGRYVRSLKEHQNYIHDMAVRDANTLISASEDGTVTVWDLRSSKAEISLEPFKQQSLVRPDLGKWVGAVDVEKDWLVCGGGVKAGLWNLTSRQLTTVYQTQNKGIHVNKLYEDRVIIGCGSSLCQFSLQGEDICSISCSCPAIYSVVLQEDPYHVMCIAGASPYIDVCTNLNYKDQVLSLRE